MTLHHTPIERIKRGREDAEQNRMVWTPTMEVWRESRLFVALSNAASANMSDMLQIVPLVVQGMQPDNIVLITDGMISKEETNPDTGREWTKHDFIDAAGGDTVASAAVQDAMLVTRCNADEYAVDVLPYHVDGQDIVWHDGGETIESWGSAEGYVTETLRAAFEGPDLRSLFAMHAPGYGLTPEMANVHIDAVILKVIMASERHTFGLFGYGDPARNALIETSLREGLPVDFVRTILEHSSGAN